MAARATRTLRHRVLAEHAAPRETGKGSICSAERGMPGEALRHTLNDACCTQPNHAPHDVLLIRATINIWGLPGELQATNSYKSTPRETQAHSVLPQIALSSLRRQKSRTPFTKRIDTQKMMGTGGVLTIVATSYILERVYGGMSIRQNRLRKAEQDADHKEASLRGSRVRGHELNGSRPLRWRLQKNW